MVIYSFDEALRGGRTMHSFELPGGKKVPLWRPIKGVDALYFMVVEVVFLALDNALPFVALINAFLSAVADGDTYVVALATYYLIIPVGIGMALASLEVDGRSVHWWLVSMACYLVRPKRQVAGVPLDRSGYKRVYRGKVVFRWDASAPRLHHGWVVGGRISTKVGVRFTHALRHKHVVVRPDDDGPFAEGYEVSGRLEVKP